MAKKNIFGGTLPQLDETSLTWCIYAVFGQVLALHTVTGWVKRVLKKQRNSGHFCRSAHFLQLTLQWLNQSQTESGLRSEMIAVWANTMWHLFTVKQNSALKCVHKSLEFPFFCRAMLCIKAVNAVVRCLSTCPAVCHVRVLYQNE